MSTMVETSVVQDKSLQLFLAFCRDHSLFQAGEKVLVAASGGLDSSVLLHMVHRASKLLNIEVEVAHVDHGLRGTASDREGAWVEVLCSRLGVPCHRHKLSAPDSASHAELRSLRRQWLTELSKDLDVSKILTAHHADDNAENFLMRAIAGSGLQGLRSMAPIKGMWVKPLLWATKDELRDYSRKHLLAWIEDPSNQRGAYLRNRLRQDVMPSLELVRMGAVRSISRTALRIEEEERELEIWVGEQLRSQSQDTNALSLGWLETWPRGIQRRILRIWLQNLGIHMQPKLVEDLLDGREIIHTRGVFLKRSAMWVFVPEQNFGSIWESSLPLGLGVRISLGESMAWSFCPAAPEPLKFFKQLVYLSLKDPRTTAPGSLVLSWRKLPQKMCLIAASKVDSKEVSAKLEAAKIPVPYRPFWPVMVNAEDFNQPLSIIGLGVLDGYEWSGEGPALVIASFFEEGLSSSEGSC